MRKCPYAGTYLCTHTHLLNDLFALRVFFRLKRQFCSHLYLHLWSSRSPCCMNSSMGQVVSALIPVLQLEGMGA